MAVPTAIQGERQAGRLPPVSYGFRYASNRTTLQPRVGLADKLTAVVGNPEILSLDPLLANPRDSSIAFPFRAKQAGRSFVELQSEAFAVNPRERTLDVRIVDARSGPPFPLVDISAYGFLAIPDGGTGSALVPSTGSNPVTVTSEDPARLVVNADGGQTWSESVVVRGSFVPYSNSYVYVNARGTLIGKPVRLRFDAPGYLPAYLEVQAMTPAGFDRSRMNEKAARFQAALL